MLLVLLLQEEDVVKSGFLKTQVSCKVAIESAIVAFYTVKSNRKTVAQPSEAERFQQKFLLGVCTFCNIIGRYRKNSASLSGVVLHYYSDCLGNETRNDNNEGAFPL
eukprot:TRINITY_DN12413_c0_g1_i1.p1 TRINITY_DN12413_c0_g1~~TRINITY_DN12413_c0_g1_i1.p1  ORF type:complete len:107 (-),score=7.09 TRINITY_DN12413_c0_g1_i1:170-490(-)